MSSVGALNSGTGLLNSLPSVFLQKTMDYRNVPFYSTVEGATRLKFAPFCSS